MNQPALWAITLALALMGIAGLLFGVGNHLGGIYTSKGRQTSGDPLVVADAILGFKRPSNATTHISDDSAELSYTIFTDDRGLRVNRPGAPHQESTDLLTLGGSFSAGHGLANEQTYTALLGDRLDLTTANAALSSYGTVASLRSLVRHSELKPDLVIYAFIDGHLRRNLDPCAPSFQPTCVPVPHLEIDEDGAIDIADPDAAVSAIAFEYAERLRNLRQQPSLLDRVALGLDALKHRTRRSLQGRDARQEDPNLRYRAFVDVLARMKNRTDRLNSRLIVVALPAMENPSVNHLGQRIHEHLDGWIDVIDFAAWIRAREAAGISTPPLILDPKDRHPNALAHELIAEAITERILKRETP
ncbi:hypothetical protein MK489_01365 [Myxococcota bacterium]|nr:hypothetical protein [Myxococcota bacterium]